MKKAWEWDYELFCSAVPVKNRTDLIEWDGLLEEVSRGSAPDA